MSKKVLIVGQGLAGTLLAYELQKRGVDVTIIDRGGNSASKITSGLMNPLTGRKYVKSWMFDALVQKATATYKALEQQLGRSLIEDLPILRALPDRNTELEWDYRTSLKDYEPYVGTEDEVDFAEVGRFIERDIPYVRIKGGFKVHIPDLIEAFRSHLPKGSMREDVFEYERLSPQDHGLLYDEEPYDELVFCEGAGAVKNPYFKDLPFNLSKGEAMVGKVPFHLKRMVKNKSFLVPWKEDEMWIGSANFWNFKDDQPSEEGQDRMWEQVRIFYKGPFEKTQALAAIKPSVKDRKPFLGTHPHHAHIHIFNGLGTKGVSLGPYFAEMMAAYLLDRKPILKEVDIRRFALK